MMLCGKWVHTKPAMLRNVEGEANQQVRGTDVADAEMCARLSKGGVEGSTTIESDVQGCQFMAHDLRHFFAVRYKCLNGG